MGPRSHLLGARSRTSGPRSHLLGARSPTSGPRSRPLGRRLDPFGGGGSPWWGSQPVGAGSQPVGAGSRRRRNTTTAVGSWIPALGAGSQPLRAGSQPLRPGSQPLRPGSQPLRPGSQPLRPGSQPLRPGSQPCQCGSQPVGTGSQPAGAGSRQLGRRSQQLGRPARTRREKRKKMGAALSIPGNPEDSSVELAAKWAKADPDLLAGVAGLVVADAGLARGGRPSTSSKSPLERRATQLEHGFSAAQGPTRAGDVQPILQQVLRHAPSICARRKRQPCGQGAVVMEQPAVVEQVADAVGDDLPLLLVEPCAGRPSDGCPWRRRPRVAVSWSSAKSRWFTHCSNTGLPALWKQCAAFQKYSSTWIRVEDDRHVHARLLHRPLHQPELISLPSTNTTQRRLRLDRAAAPPRTRR